MSILIRNADIVTVNRDMDIREQIDLLIRGQIIQKIGKNLPADDDAEIIDASGKIVMPGLINTHTHVPMSLFRGLGDDMPNRLQRLLIPLENDVLTEEMVYSATRFTLCEMLKSGTTAFADMYYYCKEIARAAENMGMRGVIGQAVSTTEAADAQNISEGFANFESLHGAFEHSALVTAAIAPHSPYLNTDQSLKICAEYSRQHDIPLLIHMGEMTYEHEKYKDQYGSVVKYLEKTGVLSERLVGAHGIYADAEDMRILSEHQVSIAHCPAGNSKSGRPVAPVYEYLENGVNVALGTDGPMSGNHMDLISVMNVTGKMQKTRYERRDILPAKTILQMATINGAKALGADGFTGSIEEGKCADLLIINPETVNMLPVYDYYSALVYAMHPNNVEDVFINGAHLVSGGQLTQISETEIICNFTQQVEQVREESLKKL